MEKENDIISDFRAENWLDENFKIKNLRDGVYDVTNSILLVIGHKGQEKSVIENFIEAWPNCCLASAYQTEYPILVNETPPKFSGTVCGSGFNHGSTNLLLIPEGVRKILILGEDD